MPPFLLGILKQQGVTVMAYQFPQDPTVGQVYGIFAWDGSAWVRRRTLRLITDLEGPTGADGTPAEYNIVVVDKSSGQVKTIPAPDYIEVE